MDSSDSDEPEKKRLHLNNNSMCFGYLAQNSVSSPDSKSVDAATLQSQNQKLVQQLDLQKHELHDFEAKINTILEKQSSYDDVLITVNQLWNQLVDDLVLLGIRAGSGKKSLQPLSFEAYSRGKIPSCAAKDIFLCRLLDLDSIESRENDESLVHINESLSLRHSATQVLMKVLEDSIELQRLEAEKINEALTGNQSAEDASINLGKIDNLMKEEVNHLNEVIDVLHVKHKEYADAMQICIRNHSVDQSEIKRLAGEVEESMGELEESRRKLVNLQMQKGIISLTTSVSSPRVQTPLPSAATTPPPVNGNLSPEKHADKSMGFREFKDSIEETKILAADRLSELQESQEDNKTLSKQLHELQNELKDDKHIYSSRSYTLLNDQLHHLNSELEHYKMHTDSLQADRSSVLRREKEVTLKADSADAVRKAIMNAEFKIGELEQQLQKCISERNELEIKMEEAVQDSGRKDINTEFQVMASALSKEIGMMEAQLNRWKETAHEALSLREQSQSLKSLLARKTSEQKNLTAKCAEQAVDIKSLKALIEKLQKDKEELQIILDMFGQQIYDNREITEIKESEQRAKIQERSLSNALEEHGLELRVRSANEAESACQKRLSAAEAEILDLRVKLDASERDVLELKEAIKIKDGVAESYISEIETIGQAYEDMQTQHQHLLQQVTERDDYNIKLVSESVKAKQAQSSLVSEKQVLEKQFQQIHTSLDSMKTRIDHSEIQMKKQIIEALKYSQEDRRLAINLETVKRELGDADKELKWFKSALTSSEKENDQIRRKTAEIQKDLDGQRKARKKIDEEMGEWSRKVEDLTLETGEAAIQKLQDEIKDCKSMLKCGVCFDRPKEVVIVKCYHLFCNACIQRNLEIRHRKCPGCGTAFGQSDVRPVKI